MVSCVFNLLALLWFTQWKTDNVCVRSLLNVRDLILSKARGRQMVSQLNKYTVQYMWLVLQPKICLEKLPECFYSHHQHQSLSSWTAWRINSIWGQRGEAKERHNGSIVSYYQKNSAEASKTVFVMSLDSAIETGVRKPTKVVVSCMKNVMEQ